MDLSNTYQINHEYREKLINGFIDSGQSIYFKKRSLVEFEYKKLNYIYLIAKGRVKQYFIDGDGIERTILILSKGDVFGEITLFQNDYDMVITEAIEDTHVIKVNEETFLKKIKENSELDISLFKLITTKFRILMAEIYDLTFYSIKDRLMSFIIRFSKQNGAEIDIGTKIDIKLTHQEIATMVGTTRSTVTKALAELQDEGLIKIENKFIVILK